MPENQLNAQSTEDDKKVPAGFIRQQVIWPGTGEKFEALLPVPKGWDWAAA